MDTNMQNENQSTYPWSFNQYSEPRTMPAGWDLSGVLAAQDMRAKTSAERRARRSSARLALKQIPLNPPAAGEDGERDYRWDAFSGPSTYPSRWNLE